MKTPLILTLLTLSVLSVFSQTADSVISEKKTFSFYTDEDLKPPLLFSEANDQNYTMGLGFGWSSPSYTNKKMFVPNRWIATRLLGNEIKNKRIENPFWSINGTAFTPDNLRSFEVVPEDRPYSFLLTLSTKESYLYKPYNVVTSQLSFGIIGLPFGEWVQKGIHVITNRQDTRPPYTPRGWDHQVSDGGEPTALYTLSSEWLLTKRGLANEKPRTNFELKHGIVGMVGYYNMVGYSLSTRMGLLNPDNWVQNFTPLGSGDKAKPNLKNQSLNLIKQKTELFIYGSIKPGFMLYNELINGGFRRSDYTLSFSETRHFIVEWNTGIGLNFPSKKRDISFIWALNAGRTSELNTSLSRNHKWGGFYITSTY